MTELPPDLLGDVALPGEDYARAIVETARAPLVVLDPDLRVEAVNPAFLATFGLEGDAVAGRSFFEIGGGFWDVPELRSILERVLPEHRMVEEYEVTATLSDLGVRTVVLNARQVRLGGAERHRVLLGFEDVTERRSAEARLRRYAVELERSNRDLEAFAHAASHDLQEPLRKIRTYVTRVVRSDDAAALGERSRSDLARVEGAVERMQVRIDDLLRLARVSRQPLRLEPVDLGNVVQSVRADLQERMAEEAGRIDVEPLPTVFADASQMTLLFQNLLVNALKYHEEGEPPVVAVRSLPPEEPETAVVEVEDRGIGFDPQYAEQIFLPFHRLHGRDRYEGSGVGLSLCRRIVERVGGSISADSRPGEGARFRVTLPTTRREEPA